MSSPNPQSSPILASVSLLFLNPISVFCIFKDDLATYNKSRLSFLLVEKSFEEF